jgi:glutaredoxin 2
MNFGCRDVKFYVSTRIFTTKHNRFHTAISNAYKEREQGTLNWEQKVSCSLFAKTKVSEFKAQSRKKMFFEMRSTKKTASLFQSHVFKHEFSLLRVARSLFPLKSEVQRVRKILYFDSFLFNKT